MRITKLHIENFKSLVDFDLPPYGFELDQFTCLIGLNGSGKTTLLQAFEFLGQLACGDMKGWLKVREWTKDDLTFRRGPFPIISFKVWFSDRLLGELIWSGEFDRDKLRCTSEDLVCAGKAMLKLDEHGLEIAAPGPEAKSTTWERLPFVFEGSVLSVLDLTEAHPALQQLKLVLLQLKSLELLSPHLLRQSAQGGGDVGRGGERLAPFVDRLSESDRLELSERVAQLYPQLSELGVHIGPRGLRTLMASESIDGGLNWTRALHLNDGMLRAIAIMAQAYSEHSILLFDEIENGMNPELIGKIVAFLLEMDRQIIVTTHSPLILNYLPDEVAKESLILLYKPLDGGTRCVRFFDIPEMQKKLEALGPGEVFADTNLTDLVERLPGGEGGPRE